MAQFGAASISARSHESVAAGIITEHPVGKVRPAGVKSPAMVGFEEG